MALLFNPPLDPHELSVYESLKKVYGGHVVNPDYLAPHRRAVIEPRLKAWCDGHEMRHWPSWVCQWWTDYGIRQAKPARAADVPERDGRVLGPGAVPSPGQGSDVGRGRGDDAEAGWPDGRVTA